MTSRISSELFEHPLDVGSAEGAAAVELFAELVPLAERDVLTDRDPAAGLVEVAPTIETANVFVPDHYEPNYAYPLLVWLENSSFFFLFLIVPDAPNDKSQAASFQAGEFPTRSQPIPQPSRKLGGGLGWWNAKTRFTRSRLTSTC